MAAVHCGFNRMGEAGRRALIVPLITGIMHTGLSSFLWGGGGDWRERAGGPVVVPKSNTCPRGTYEEHMKYLWS